MFAGALALGLFPRPAAPRFGRVMSARCGTAQTAWSRQHPGPSSQRPHTNTLPAHPTNSHAPQTLYIASQPAHKHSTCLERLRERRGGLRDRRAGLRERL